MLDAEEQSILEAYQADRLERIALSREDVEAYRAAAREFFLPALAGSQPLSRIPNIERRRHAARHEPDNEQRNPEDRAGGRHGSEHKQPAPPSSSSLHREDANRLP